MRVGPFNYVVLPFTVHRVIKPAKRVKEARNWVGGSVSKKDLDCSVQPKANGTNGLDSLNGGSLTVDVSVDEGRRGRQGGYVVKEQKRG